MLGDLWTRVGDVLKVDPQEKSLKSNIYRSISRTISKDTEAEEDEYTDEIEKIDARIKYDQLLQFLRCSFCKETSTQPVIQCRKGHVYCKSCKAANKIIQCNVCKQTLLDAPNPALDSLLSMITLPCKYRNRGCEALLFSPDIEDHDKECKNRPLPCQFQSRGCKAVFSQKDIVWHHRMCQYSPAFATSHKNKKNKKPVVGSNLSTPGDKTGGTAPSTPCTSIKEHLTTPCTPTKEHLTTQQFLKS